MLRGNSITEFFKEKNILITGGTGFLGMTLVEKLLRSFPEIGKIHLVIRGNKQASAKSRSERYFESKLFSRVREMHPTLNSKIEWHEGDLCAKNLGLSDGVTEELKKSLDIIVHSAATVNLNEPLKSAIDVNIGATKNMLELAKCCDNIKCFIDVSTAYVNHKVTSNHIKEIIYTPPIDPEELLELSNSLETTSNERERIPLDGSPNTYMYTKNAAETLVFRYRNVLPIGIFRPAIISHSYAEPYPYWLTGNTHFTKLLHSFSNGLELECAPDAYINSVPVDMTVSGLLAAIANIGLNLSADEIQIYNYTTCSNPCMTNDLERFYKSGIRDRNLDLGKLKLNATLYTKASEILAMGGTIEDAKKVMQRFDRFVETIKPFVTVGYHYDNSNVEKLWNSMDEDGKKLLPFDFEDFSWEEYYSKMYEGAKNNEEI